MLDPYEKERIEQDFGRPLAVGESSHGMPFQARQETNMMDAAYTEARKEFSFLVPPSPEASESPSQAQPFRFSTGL